MHEQELFSLSVMNQFVIIKRNKEFSFQLAILSPSHPSGWGVLVRCWQRTLLLHASNWRDKRKEEGHLGRNEHFFLETSYHVLLISQSNTYYTLHFTDREGRLENIKFLNR